MFKHGSFRHHPGEASSTGSKTPPASSPHEKEHGPAQAPHGQAGPEHVTKTHPGETQPHPVTGVHAFQAHHQGGGKYKSHTHHDGGEVETREHPNHGDMMNSMNEALPDEGQEAHGGQGNDIRDGSMDFSESLGGVGGETE
jgi:hypothetical protein